MPESDLYKVENMALCSKQTLLVLHEPSTNNISLYFANRKECDLDLATSEIVSSVDFTFIESYISFMDEEPKISVMTALIEMFAKIGHVSVFERSPKGTFPQSFKDAFVSTLKCLRRYYQGSYITELFVKKLRQIVVKIWHHGQIYQNFNGRRYNLAFNEVTSYVC